MCLGRGLIEQGGGNGELLGIGHMGVQAWMVSEMLRNESGAELAADELGVLQQAGEQTLVALHA
ncbi:hypothetical protein D3C76_1803590 [compost metagenome]